VIPGCRRALCALIAALAIAAAAPAQAQDDADTYDIDTIIDAGEGFFGATSEGVAKVIEKVFEEYGRPNAFITGEEIAGAIGVGVRYGRGQLNSKKEATRDIYWQGPSVGFDVGGNAAKAFVLIYHLPAMDTMFQRFPGVEGSLYFVAGFSVNVHKSGDVVLVPIRTGVGWRAGANVGYLHFTPEHSWLPL
jgi:hypothetical protein